MSDADKGEIKSLLMKARKEPMNFGLALGAKPEEMVLLLSKTKAGDALAREAKKLAGSSKSVGGRLSLAEKDLSLSCIGRAPSGTAKALMLYLKSQIGLTLMVGLTETDAPAEAGPTAEAPPGPNMDDAVKQLMPQIQAAVVANPAAKEALLKAVAALRQAQDAATGAKLLAQLTAVLDKLAGAAPKLSIVKLGKARLEWIDTRLSGTDAIAKLKAAIAQDYADMPEAGAAVKKAADRLDQLIGGLNVALHEQLDLVLNAEGPTRDKEAEKARVMVRNFLKFVESDPVMKELDGNEFLPGMAVNAPIRAKLAEIVAALG